MKTTINWLLAFCCGLILIGCNSGGSSSGTPSRPTVNISLSSGSNTDKVPTEVVALTLNFNEAVNGVSPNTVQVESPGSATNVITEAPQQRGNSYTFNLSNLTHATTYTVSLTNGITSQATGIPIVVNPFSFTTVDPNIPTVQILGPINDSTEVALNAQVILQFSEAVIGVDPTTIAWTNSGTVIPFTYIESPVATYTLKPEPGVFLEPNTLYTVRIRNGIISTVNYPNEVPPTAFIFTTANPLQPTVSLTSPNPTTNVSLTPTITLTFSEAVSNVNTTTIQFESTGGTPQIITIIESGNSYTLTPSGSLLPGTQYVVLVNSDIRSVATGAQIVPTTFNFTTVPPPTVSLTSPNPTTNVSLTPTITLTFSEAVTNVNTTTIKFESNGGQPKSITISASGNSYTLNLSEPLAYNTLYVVLVNSGVQSVATGALVAPIQFSFMTKPRLLSSLGTPIATSLLPYGISVSPDSNNVYVTNFNSSTVSQYSRSSSGLLTAIGTVATGANPYGINVSPDGKNVYVVNNGSNTVSQYSRSASGLLTAIGTVATDYKPIGISISADDNNVYVLNQASGTVSQYSRSESGRLTAIGTPVATGSTPIGIVISPDGSNLYVTNYNSLTISQYSRDASGILTAIDTVATGGSPWGLGISPDGNNVYVLSPWSGIVLQYSRSSSGITAIGAVATGNTPQKISISSDGNNAYVINYGSGTVSQYSRSSSGILTAIGTPIATGTKPREISISPDGNNVYVINATSNTVSQYSR